MHKDGPAEPVLVRVQQTTRKNTGSWLQSTLPASPFNSLPDLSYPGSSGSYQETSSTLWPPGQQEKGICCGESLCKHAEFWRLLFCAALQDRAGFSGSRALATSNPFQQFQWPKAFPQAYLLHRTWRSKTNLPSASHRTTPSGLRPQQSESPITCSLFHLVYA